MTISSNPQLNYLDLLRSGDLELFGGDIGTEGSIITSLGDGTDINVMFQEISDLLSVWNQNLDSLVSLLTFSTTSPADMVLQKADGAKFEKASEFGVPKGQKFDPALLLGYDFEDWDVALRYTWKFLRDANKAQIRNSIDNILAGHSKTIVSTVLQRLFDNSQISTPEGNISYGLWAGDMAPLPVMGKTFDASHTHYLVSGAAQLDSEDIEVLQNLVIEHQYGRTKGSQLLLLVSDTEADIISGFRAGVVNNNTKVAKFSFIPSASSPAYLTDKSIVGSIAPGDLDGGIPIVGSYGRMWVVPHPAVPAGYVSVLASSGKNSPSNPVGLRQHPRPEYQGLRLIPGNWSGSPLIESFAAFSLGTGVRNRGAGAVMQISTGTNDDYSVPEINL